MYELTEIRVNDCSDVTQYFNAIFIVTRCEYY